MNRPKMNPKKRIAFPFSISKMSPRTKSAVINPKQMAMMKRMELKMNQMTNMRFCLMG